MELVISDRTILEHMEFDFEDMKNANFLFARNFYHNTKLWSGESLVGAGLLLLMSSRLPISLSMPASMKAKISFAVKTCHIHLRAQ